MSLINTIRFININYNNDNIRINDEILYFAGKSTLISLENGGGKSVMIQMIMAPFVQKSRRDLADRKFSNYFLTSNPSFILIEWNLDGSVNEKVLTGMMVRKNQHIDENNENELDVINFVSEYNKQCDTDIYHLPVIDFQDNQKFLKSYAECLNLFDDFKKDRSFKFYYYDMNSPSQATNYFNKIREFGINYKEWHEIIREVNKEEGGLSKIFSECKNERRLVEKWILPKIEAKLNKESDIIVNLQNSTEQFILHRHQIDFSVVRKDAILQFKNKSEEILNHAQILNAAENEVLNNTNFLKFAVLTLYNLIPLLNNKISEINKKILEVDTDIKFLQYQEYSLKYYQQNDELQKLKDTIEENKKENDELDKLIEETKRIINIYSCQMDQKTIDDLTYSYKLLLNEQEIAKNKLKDYNAELDRLGAQLKKFYTLQIENCSKSLSENQNEILLIEKNIADNNEQNKNYNLELQKLHESIGTFKGIINDYQQNEDSYFIKYQVDFGANLFALKYEYPLSKFAEHAELLEKERETLLESLANFRATQTSLDRKTQEIEKKIDDLNQALKQVESEKSGLTRDLESLELELKERRIILNYLDLTEEVLFDLTLILNASLTKIAELDTLIQRLIDEQREVAKTLKQYQQGFLKLTPELEQFFKDLEIPLTYGFEWLKRHPLSLKEKQELVAKQQFLPYALILEEADLPKLESAKKIPTAAPIPLITRKSLNDEEACNLEALKVHFYMHFDADLLDEELIKAKIEACETKLVKLEQEQNARKEERAKYQNNLTVLKRQRVTRELYAETENKLKGFLKRMEELQAELLASKEQKPKIKLEIAKTQQLIEKGLLEVKNLEQQISDFKDLQQKYEKYLVTQEKLKQCEQSQNLISQKIEAISLQNQALEPKLKFSRDKSQELLVELKTLQTGKFLSYQSYADLEALEPDFDLTNCESQYDAILAASQKDTSVNLPKITENLKSYQEKIASYSQKLSDAAKSYNLVPDDWKNSHLTQADQQRAQAEDQDLGRRKKEAEIKRTNLAQTYGSQSAKLETALLQIKDRCKYEEPLPREQIQERNFSYELKQYLDLKSSFERDLEQQKKVLQHLDNTYGVYQEFYDQDFASLDLELPEYFSFEKLDSKKISDFIKNKLDLLNKNNYEVEKLKHNLSNLINTIYSNNIYDPIRPLLPNLQAIANSSAKIISEIPVKIKILDAMIQKLDKDITKIDEEKNIIIDLLFDYIEKVHQQLNSIDKNSSIKIREQSKKTLRINIPEWDENKALFKNRIRDILDALTVEGMGLLNSGEDIHDMVALNLTTRDLYDKIVGISNVKIHLIKVESQREVVIPWNSVTTNSGGEGFLSAFIVLSSLLSYMRHDDSDQFITGKKEGKTLIMDNPFGKTNAAHLLKPLMEIAKKNNLQLICLTGLGGDSIYDRFDNIYILNLVPAGENGVTYLKSTKQKGEQPSVLTSSRFQVLEDQSFIKDLFNI
ncbi:MAG: hypothetical protein IJU40_06405, partial [Desulfovibrionaceae bacterium]|nr:hypothetical protein [Desulfovibrionaceae bacterium]